MSKLHDMEVDDYLSECVTIIPEAIQEEFCRVPADIAYWGEQCANALRSWKKAKLYRERVEAEQRIAQREALIVGGTSRPTVGDIEAAVYLTEVYEEAKLAEIEAEATHAALKSRFSAVYAKKDMVKELGAQLRVEMSADPVVRDAVRSARQAREYDDDKVPF